MWKVIAKLSDNQIALLVAFVILTLVLIIFLPIVLSGILQVVSRGETHMVQSEVNRAEDLLRYETERLAQNLTDWAFWDETYHFARDGDQDYIESNLSDLTFTHLDIDGLLIFNYAEKLLVAKYVDRQTQSQAAFPFDIQTLLADYPLLLDNSDPPYGHEGIAVVSDLPMLIASRPVLTSLEEGPPTGTLVFIRLLGPRRLAEFSELGHGRFSLYNTTAPFISDQILIRPQDANTIYGTSQLVDLNGQPRLVLQVENGRDLFHQGRKTAILFSLALLFFLLLLSTGIYYLIRAYQNTQRMFQTYLRRFQAIVNQSHEAMFLISDDGQILDANPAGKNLLGWKPDQTQTGPLSLDLKFEPELSKTCLIDLCQTGSVSEHHCTRRDGAEFDVELTTSLLADPEIQAYSLILRDVTRRKEAEKALKTSEERYMLAANGANDGLWDWNLVTGDVYYSLRWKSMLGYTNDGIQPMVEEWFDRVHPDDLLALQSLLADHLGKNSDNFQCEHRVRHRDDAYRWVLARGVAVWDSSGCATRIAGSVTDVTEEKKLEQQLRHDALHDPLTGLGNRTLLIEHLIHVNEHKKRKPELLFALFFLDFDRFKQINDTMGHHSGDQLLVEAARRLDSGLRATDTVARYSGLEALARIAGDEFVILLEDLRSVEDIQVVAERIISILNIPYPIGDREVTLTASMGMVIPDAPYEQAEDIIRDADIAMYHAKQQGGARVVQFCPEMYQGTLERMQLENELHRAIHRREFEVYYQPIYSLDSDSIVGLEALVRWNHPHQGILLPQKFIGIVEETGLIMQLGNFVLEESCRQMRRWQDQHLVSSTVTLSVNLSGRQILNDRLIESVRLILEKTRFDPHLLWLEVTENAFLSNSEAAISHLNELRDLGIRIEIDDFGTGFSSFRYLQDLPVEGFKIDRMFIKDIENGGQQIVKTLVELSQHLGLFQVAEGVETEGQKEYLKSISCHYAQGYLMSKAVSATEIEELLQPIR